MTSSARSGPARARSRADVRRRASASGLVTAQIALSMGLLIMSALFLKSLMNVSKVDLGVKVDNDRDVPDRAAARSATTAARSAVLFNRVEQELAALPGVTGVTEGLVPLLSGDNWGNSVHVQGFTCGPDIDCGSRFNEIGADYFKTFGVQLIAGREFTPADQLGAQRVVIVNEAFAKKFKLGTDVVGKFMGDDDNDSLNVQIVGARARREVQPGEGFHPARLLSPVAAGCAQRQHVLLREVDTAARADPRHSPRDDEAHRPEPPRRGAQDDERSRSRRTSSSTA